MSLGLIPLEVQFLGNQIKQIKNRELLKEVVTTLKVRDEFITQFEKQKSVTVKTILALIRPLGSFFLAEIAKSRMEEIDCVEYLTQSQDSEFKPVPAFEVISNGHIVTTEDTFIFTISYQGRLYLVWQSTLHGRATYMFTTNLEDYEETIQNIYDYIASHQKAKRMKLRKKDLQVGDLNCIAFITHSSFEHWKEKLTQAILN